MSADWVLARTKPSQEQYAALNIRRQAHTRAEPYVPLYFDKRRSMRVALFPSYIFVRIRDGYFHFLNSTFGVSSVMMSTNGPATVPRSVIKDLKKRENDHGVILLPEQVKDSFKSGDAIRVEDNRSPFGGLIGLYEGMASKDRVMVLLELLGRKVSVQVPTRSIVAA